MAAEKFRDFFEAGIRVRFHEMRCSKSCYLYDLKLVPLFDDVEEGVFSRMIFLVPGQLTLVFTPPVASYRFFQSISVLIFTLRILLQPMSMNVPLASAGGSMKKSVR